MVGLIERIKTEAKDSYDRFNAMPVGRKAETIAKVVLAALAVGLLYSFLPAVAVPLTVGIIVFYGMTHNNPSLDPSTWVRRMTPA